MPQRRISGGDQNQSDLGGPLAELGELRFTGKQADSAVRILKRRAAANAIQ
jgi:hypothetical protein